MRWVSRIARPNPVSTTSAPCRWARSATVKAMERSVRTPVMSRRWSARSMP